METIHWSTYESKPVRRTGSPEALLLSFGFHLKFLCLETKKSDCWPSNHFMMSGTTSLIKLLLRLSEWKFPMLTEGASFFLKTALNFPPAWMTVPSRSMGRPSLFQVDPYMSSNAGALFCGMLFIALVVATYWYYPKTGLGGFFPIHRVFHLFYPGTKANVGDRRPRLLGHVESGAQTLISGMLSAFSAPESWQHCYSLCVMLILTWCHSNPYRITELQTSAVCHR